MRESADSRVRYAMDSGIWGVTDSGRSRPLHDVRGTSTNLLYCLKHLGAPFYRLSQADQLASSDNHSGACSRLLDRVVLRARCCYNRETAVYTNDPSRVINRELGTQEVPECVSWEFSHVLLSGPGVISTTDNEIVAESVEDYLISGKRVPGFRTLPSNIYLDRRKGDVGRLSGTYVLLKKRFGANYGHFLTELLPKIYALQKSGMFADRKVIIEQYRSQSMRDMVRDILYALGVKQKNILELDNRNTYLVENLIHVSSTALSHLGWTSPMVAECCEHVAQLLGTPEPEGRPCRRIYISRSPDTGSRRPKNEQTIIRILKKYGFETIYCEKLTLRETIDIFSSADIIVGIYGSGIANALFSPRGSALVCLVPENFPGGEFWDITAAKRHRYYALFGKTFNSNKNNKNTEFEVDVGQLMGVLDMVMGSDRSTHSGTSFPKSQ